MWPRLSECPGCMYRNRRWMKNVLVSNGGWSGGAKVLGKLPVPGRPTILIIVGQVPTVLAVGAGGVVWTFFSPLSFLFSFTLSLGDGPM